MTHVLILCPILLLYYSPTHAAVDCGSPPDVSHGLASFSSTKMGSSVRYSCMQGTVMAGSSSSTCTKFGTWSNAAPTCRVKYTTRNDNTYKNNDKGYKMYSG